MRLYLKFIGLLEGEKVLHLLEEINRLNAIIAEIDLMDDDEATKKIPMTNEEFPSVINGKGVAAKPLKSSFKKAVSTSQRGVKKEKSQYTGVFWDKRTGMYNASVQYKGKKLLHAQFKTEYEAVIARDKTIAKYYLPFPLQALTKKEIQNNEKP